jgi:hypothetical protein
MSGAQLYSIDISVMYREKQREPFDVQNEVRQSCIFSPMISILGLDSIM